MLLAVALGRAVALVAVTRLRAAGFELAWSSSSRVHRAPRGRAIHLEAELRNRSDETVRVVGLRPIASTMLDVALEPQEIDVPGRSIARLDVTVVPKRVGRWGLHGVALEARGAPLGGEGLYEVPLLFSSPLGVEVMPASLAALPLHPTGRAVAPQERARWARPARLRGDGDELRELRDHVPGDPFKRIAWKASARRGRLLVREMEREERDVVWLVVDASVELWAGEPGKAPLDEVVEHVGALAAGSAARGRPRGGHRVREPASLVDRAREGRGARGAHRCRAGERRELRRWGPVRARRGAGCRESARACAPPRPQGPLGRRAQGPRPARSPRLRAPLASSLRATRALRNHASGADLAPLPRRVRHRGSAPPTGRTREGRAVSCAGARSPRDGEATGEPRPRLVAAALRCSTDSARSRAARAQAHRGALDRPSARRRGGHFRRTARAARRCDRRRPASQGRCGAGAR